MMTGRSLIHQVETSNEVREYQANSAIDNSYHPQPTNILMDTSQKPIARASNSKSSQNAFGKTTLGNWILGPVLGEGEFGKVRIGWPNKKAMESGGESQVAIKLIRKQNINGERSKLMKIKREIDILSRCSHPNIVRLIDVIEADKIFGIVLSCASGGELFDYILQNKYLKDPIAGRLFAQLISGVNYLHMHGIVHRDLKLENLLLDSEKNVIITDFGFATCFKNQIDYYCDSDYIRFKPDLMETSCGSPCYAAPELVMSEGKYEGRKVDVWSCGVILYAMLAGYLPFDDDPNNPDSANINILYKYITTTPLTFPNYISPLARSLLHIILVPDPRKRASLKIVSEHAFLEPFWFYLKAPQYRDGKLNSNRENLHLQRQYLRKQSAIMQAHATNPAEKRLSVQLNPRSYASPIQYQYHDRENTSSQKALLQLSNANLNTQRSNVPQSSLRTGTVKRDSARERLPMPAEKPRPTSYHPAYGMPPLSMYNDYTNLQTKPAHARHGSLIQPVSTTTKSTCANAPGELVSTTSKRISISADNPMFRENIKPGKERPHSMFVFPAENDEYLLETSHDKREKDFIDQERSKNKQSKPLSSLQGIYNFFAFGRRPKTNKSKDDTYISESDSDACFSQENSNLKTNKSSYRIFAMLMNRTNRPTKSNQNSNCAEDNV